MEEGIEASQLRIASFGKNLGTALAIEVRLAGGLRRPCASIHSVMPAGTTPDLSFQRGI